MLCNFLANLRSMPFSPPSKSKRRMMGYHFMPIYGTGERTSGYLRSCQLHYHPRDMCHVSKFWTLVVKVDVPVHYDVKFY